MATTTHSPLAVIGELEDLSREIGTKMNAAKVNFDLAEYFEYWLKINPADFSTIGKLERDLLNLTGEFNAHIEDVESAFGDTGKGGTIANNDIPDVMDAFNRGYGVN